MKRDFLSEFSETEAPDLDADLDRFINEGRPDFARIILESTPDWTLGDPDFWSVP